MLGALFLSAAASTAATAQMLDPLELNPLLSTRSITKRCAGDELPKAEYSLTLAGKVRRPSYKHAAYESLRELVKEGGRVGPYTQSVAGADLDEEYITNITIGGQHFSVIVDTGSSDTWLIEKGFKCFSLADKPVTQSECNFGPVYSPGESTTYEHVADKNFNISYGDGEFLTGSIARETVEIAGMTVKHQKIGVVNRAAWDGDGISSGLMGLAYPDLTSQFNGTNPDVDSFTGKNANWVPYLPLFYKALQEKVLKNPMFSIALNRDSIERENSTNYDPNLGYISLGGVAPVPTVGNSTAAVPIQKLQTQSIGSVYLYYTVNASFYSAGVTRREVPGVILDTGTTLNYVPDHLAKAFNEAFDPPATYRASWGAYVVDCDAKVPEFIVELGDMKYPIHASDQKLPIQEGNTCLSGTQPGGTVGSGSIFILGDVFLHNVVMTFNREHEEVFITMRQPYN